MKFSQSISPLILGTSITTALVITLPQTAQALSGTEVNDIAREITVLITSENSGHGSGVIVAKNDKTYYVLTAYHVVQSQDNYKLVAPDKQAYAIDYSKVKRLPDVDLAILEFTSDRNYQIAKLSNATTSEGQEMFVSGWPGLASVGNEAGGGLVRQFTSGSISGFLPQPYQGYQIIYTNVTRGGMSGGPVLDAGGRVIGIHGLGDKEDPSQLLAEGFSEEAASIASKIKPGFNYAIPIETCLQKASQARIYLGWQVDSSPAPSLGTPYQASTQPDPRDTIDDLNQTLNTINNVGNTIRNITNIFRGF
jgi:S1-C subfamily serine protease